MKKPKHIAIIMDGNGRWAEKRHLTRNLGHRKGVETMESIISACLAREISVLSLYLLSTENMQRPKDEVDGLMDIARKYFKRTAEFKKNGIRVLISGCCEGIPDDIVAMMENTVSQTAECSRIRLNLCFNYGGRREIAHAVNRIIADKRKTVDETLISRYMYNDLPDPDIIIRTGGDMRLSNFLLYQSAYSELYFTPCLWPDFDEAQLDIALIEYSKRKRNFGKR